MARVTFISRMTVKAAEQTAFIRVCERLQAHVRANEPGTLYFEFFRMREPNRFMVLESFRDEAAEKLHMESPFLAEVLPVFIASVEGSWEREYFDPLS